MVEKLVRHISGTTGDDVSTVARLDDPQWNETWDHLKVEAEEYLDAGEFVVVLLRFRGVGRASGAPVEQATYHVFTMRNGKVARMVEYGPGKRSEAFEAAGLSE